MIISFCCTFLDKLLTPIVWMLNVETPLYFIANVLWLLFTKWGPHWKTLFLQDIKLIMGTLGEIDNTALWLQFLLPDLYASITQYLCLHHNHCSVTNKRFCDPIKLQKNYMIIHNHSTYAGAHSSKTTHLPHHQHLILKALQEEFALIMTNLNNNNFSWQCLIAHCIPREP